MASLSRVSWELLQACYHWGDVQEKTGRNVFINSTTQRNWKFSTKNLSQSHGEEVAELDNESQVLGHGNEAANILLHKEGKEKGIPCTLPDHPLSPAAGNPAQHFHGLGVSLCPVNIKGASGWNSLAIPSPQLEVIYPNIDMVLGLACVLSIWKVPQVETFV